jgi:hypothetical protein
MPAVVAVAVAACYRPGWDFSGPATAWSQCGASAHKEMSHKEMRCEACDMSQP